MTDINKSNGYSVPVFDSSVIDELQEYIRNKTPVIKPERIGKAEFYYVYVHPDRQAEVDQMIEDGILVKMGGRVFGWDHIDRILGND